MTMAVLRITLESLDVASIGPPQQRPKQRACNLILTQAQIQDSCGDSRKVVRRARRSGDEGGWGARASPEQLIRGHVGPRDDDVVVGFVQQDAGPAHLRRLLAGGLRAERLHLKRLRLPAQLAVRLAAAAGRDGGARGRKVSAIPARS